MAGLRATAPAELRPSLVEEAYDALKSAIRNNIFAPGYQGSEHEIAQQLGISRTPVHEAIIRLQEEGLVRVLPRRGVVVTALSVADMREIYDVILAVEAAAAERTAGLPEAERRDAAAMLASLNDGMAQALAADDLPGWAEADGQFHRALVASSGNARLLRIFRTVMDQSHRARMLTVRLRPKPVQSVQEHAAIIAAIAAGEAAGAFQQARQHRGRARDQILPLLQGLGMQHL